MGPPLKAAENENTRSGSIALSPASMGPPLKAAENGRRVTYARTAAAGFNGAAAKSSGKCLLGAFGAPEPDAASMGPPLKAAENGSPDAAPRYVWRLQWGRR